MEFDVWWEAALNFVRENETWIEIALFFFAFAESIIFASVFVPSTPLFIAIGALEGAAEGPLVPLIIAGTLGAIAGDLASFTIGFVFRRRLPELWPLRNHPKQLEQARAFVERWGIVAILVSKLSGPMRPIVPMLVGASEMSRIKFFAASAVSSVVWAVIVLMPAYYGLHAMTH
ncbi:MAG: DedA family protein [Filomicrobium sp.]